MQNCSWTHPRGAFDSALFANNKTESVFPHSFSVLFSAALREIKTDAFRDSQRQREREKKPNPQGCVKSSTHPGRDIFRCEPVLPHDFPGVLIVTIPESLWHTCHRLCRSLICVATDRGWIYKEPKKLDYHLSYPFVFVLAFSNSEKFLVGAAGSASWRQFTYLP